ncbi:MAG TPA: [LysW]-lysine hydrolase [Candidatus Limnocylindrales bacterium]|nr:[LysW]-lysine hydrolase [Candidatus Limnocylindrales bacterium]
MGNERAETRLLRELVEIPSPSGQEGRIAQHLVSWMDKLGYRTGIDEVGNAVGEIGDPDGPTVVLLGHMDTVPGEVPVRVEGTRLYGRGSVDAKGPLAAFVCAGARVGDIINARLVVIGAVDEERDSVGARHAAGQYRPDAVVVGEPSGADAVVIGYKGVLRFLVQLHRPPTHSSSPEPKAVEEAVRLWQAIHGSCPVDPGSPLFDQTIPTLLSIEGDMREARVVVSCRTPVGFDSGAFEDWLRSAVGDDNLTVLERTPAVRRPRTDPVARALCAAIRRAGATPATKVKLGTADMNVVAEHWPVPTAVYGPGDSRLDHSAEEHIDLDEYLHAISVLAAALPEIAQISGMTDTRERAGHG